MSDAENGTEMKGKYDPVATSPDGRTKAISKGIRFGIPIGIGIVIGIIVAVACGVYFSSRKPAPATGFPATADTPMATPTTTPTTSPATTTPYPGTVLLGDFNTDQNFTESLNDKTSAAYQAMEQSFIQAIEQSYSASPYASLLDGVFVDEFVMQRGRVQILFTIHLSQLDNDNASPDAQDYLQEDVADGRLGTSSFRIITSSILIQAPSAPA